MLTTIEEPMDLMKKLEILADAAKYDVACTSSGVDRKNDGTGIGNLSLIHILQQEKSCIFSGWMRPQHRQDHKIYICG